jgi:hypothetical protein
MNAIPRLHELRPQTISDAERKRREKAAARAKASLRIEGLTRSVEAEAISKAWQRGEITGEEMTERVKALYVRRD